MCDRENFDKLLQPMEDLLLNVIYGKIKDREISKEIYHNVIVLGMSKLHQLKDVQKFPAWIFTITRNEIAAYVKREQKKAAMETPIDIQDPLNTPILYQNATENVEKIVLNRDERNQLKRAIYSLEDTDRIIVWMAYYQEMSLAEIADILNMSLGAVKMRKKRALNKLRENINL